MEQIINVILAEPILKQKLDEVESSYVKHFLAMRDFWASRTPEQLEETFPGFRFSQQSLSSKKERFPTWNEQEDYYKSQYYKFKQEGALYKNTPAEQRWVARIQKQAKAAREHSIFNLVKAVNKVLKDQPLETFKVSDIRIGKGGIEGFVHVNSVTKHLFAIYAEGDVQRLHIRFLIK